jgi:hypothetical protein
MSHSCSQDYVNGASTSYPGAGGPGPLRTVRHGAAGEPPGTGRRVTTGRRQGNRGGDGLDRSRHGRKRRCGSWRQADLVDTARDRSRHSAHHLVTAFSRMVRREPNLSLPHQDERRPNGRPGGTGAPRAHGYPAKGLSTWTPASSKSVTLRVTTVMPCTRAVAAMSASITGRGCLYC